MPVSYKESPDVFYQFHPLFEGWVHCGDCVNTPAFPNCVGCNPVGLVMILEGEGLVEVSIISQLFCPFEGLE